MTLDTQRVILGAVGASLGRWLADLHEEYHPSHAFETRTLMNGPDTECM